MELTHTTVLLEETVQYLNVKPEGIYVDGTLGGGGHSLKIAKALGSGGHLIGIDQDEVALEIAKKRLTPYLEKITLVRDNFKNVKKALYYRGFEEIDGIIFDLGFSSLQVDDYERGFSYKRDAVLDMRMDQRQELTAREIVNSWNESELTRIIKEYGEEKWASRIAQFIVRERQRKQIDTTQDLVDLIKAAIPASARRSGPHPAKRTFQALRIAVNDELGVLKKALKDSLDLLKPGGRICVIAFHSLEDRIVKQFFRDLSKDCICPKDFPICVCGVKPVLKVITRKPITPGQEELEKNSRARSAFLRVAEKL
ncbi:MAG: 16S rRNA (cytosine(1402)-N(4))-methyltransferase RsmH [Halanaerobiales bacterium]|nr:16S rRNA (cytosine(1402)-N(4))-methyltransferase RsmH [Halanaerobiales bacterium]